MRKLDSVDVTLAAEVVADALSAVTKQSAVELGEVVDSRAPLDKPDDGDEGLSIDFIIALQSGSLKSERVTTLEEDDSAVIKEHQDLAAKLSTR